MRRRTSAVLAGRTPIFRSIFIMTRSGRICDKALYEGEFSLVDIAPVPALFKPVKLLPGESYQVCVHEPNHGPTSRNFLPLAFLTVYCLLQKRGKALIGEDTHSFGGTWSRHQVPTNVPTNIVFIGVSRIPTSSTSDQIPILDAN